MQLLGLDIHPAQYQQLSDLAKHECIRITNINPSASETTQDHVERRIIKLADMLTKSYHEAETAMRQAHDSLTKTWQHFLDGLRNNK